MLCKKFAVPLLFVFVSACSDSAPLPVVGGLDRPASKLIVDCDTSAASYQCTTITGPWPDHQTLGPLGDSPYEALNDPAPYNTPGIWLGANVSPQSCYADMASFQITDTDHDWLADNCEYEIAKAFAPTLREPISSTCGGGEPYWAAKYFQPTQSVRIAYLLSYYRDCGPEGIVAILNKAPWISIGPGHDGDSEIITIDVEFDASTQHWKFKDMMLSAHLFTDGDRSRIVTTNAEFSWRSLAHPVVWVSDRKHANYPSYDVCTQTYIGDTCENGYLTLRVPVETNRNIGSRFVHQVDCVNSTTGYNPSKYECYYSGSSFTGWQNGSTSATGYGSLLPVVFEASCRTVAFQCDQGPGPNGYNAPLPTSPTVSGSVVNGYPVITWPAASGAAYYKVFSEWYRYSTQEGSNGFEDHGASVSPHGEGIAVQSCTCTTVPGFNTPGYVKYYVMAYNNWGITAQSNTVIFKLAPQ